MNKILAAAVAAAILAPAGAAMAAPAPTTVTAKVGGFVQVDYRRGKADSATNNGEQQFNIRRARINVSGDINEMLSYGMEYQADNTNTGTISGMDPMGLLDAYGLLKFHPMLNVKAGLFKPQFDMEGGESDTVNPFMDRANIVTKLKHPVLSARDVGVQFSGGSDASMPWGYALGLFQGSENDTTSNTGTDGDNKFRMVLNGWLAPMAGVKVNAGWSNNDSSPKSGATDKNTTLTFGAAYDTNPIFARFEYYTNDFDNATPNKTKTSGWYLTGGYTVMPDLDVLLRYQSMGTKDEDVSSNDNKLTSIDVGVKYFLDRQGAHGGSNVQLNYMIRDADAGVSADMLNEGSGVMVTGDKVDNVLALRLQIQIP